MRMPIAIEARTLVYTPPPGSRPITRAKTPNVPARMSPAEVTVEPVRRRDRPPEVIVLTTFDADDHVLRALCAGASGFLLKDAPPADIVRAIRAVAAGEPMLSPAITRRLIGHVTESDGGERRRHAREQLDRLTEREREVAVAIGRGKSNAEISRELYMSIATVKAHVSRLLEKLGFNNRVQIALLAHDAGEA